MAYIAAESGWILIYAEMANSGAGTTTTTILHRDSQLQLLIAFVNVQTIPYLGLVIVHGYKSSGKTKTVTSHIQNLGVDHTIVNCDECITPKILIQQALQGYSNAATIFLDRIGDYGDNFTNFITALEIINEETNYDKPHILVLDRIDRCMDSSNDLFTAFARLKENSSVKNLMTIMITASDDPSDISTNSIPHIFFNEYSEEEIVDILQNDQICKFDTEELDSNPSSKDFWKQYIKMIVDLFYHFTGPDLCLLIDISIRLWDLIKQPVLDGRYTLNDFFKIYQENRDIFANEDIMNNAQVIDYATGLEEVSDEIESISDLPVHSKFILIAAYLASFNEPRTDPNFFSKMKMKKKKLTASPQKLARLKKGTMTKGDIDSTLLQPSFFDLERMLAILSVIYRAHSKVLLKSEREEILNIYEDPSIAEEKKQSEIERFTLSRNTDLNSQIATLYSLGFLVKTASSDILGAKIRWKCNITLATAELLAAKVNFPIYEYLNSNQFA